MQHAFLLVEDKHQWYLADFNNTNVEDILTKIKILIL